jgi:hypothetical protein
VAERKGMNYYSITERGRKALSKLDAGSGEVAAARCAVSTAIYTGERATPMRAGAGDAFELPSLHEGERIERKRPMIIGAAVEPVRQGRS